MRTFDEVPGDAGPVAEAAALLGVRPGATAAEVEAAWSRSRRVVRPGGDRSDPAAETLAAAIDDARDLLLSSAAQDSGEPEAAPFPPRPPAALAPLPVAPLLPERARRLDTAMSDLPRPQQTTRAPEATGPAPRGVSVAAVVAVVLLIALALAGAAWAVYGLLAP